MAKRAMLALWLGTVLLCGQTAGPNWQPLQFLIGKWKGSGAGEPGAGQGAFSFLPELNGQILVRRSFNQVVAGPRHEDLMIVYMDGEVPRAIYFDSENHIIKYDVKLPSGNAAVFESDGPPGYRLSYTLDGKNLNGKFEVGGKTYLTWTAVKD